MPRFLTKNESIFELWWCFGVCMMDFQQSLCQFIPVYPHVTCVQAKNLVHAYDTEKKQMPYGQVCV